MKIISFKQKNFAEELKRLFQRKMYPSQIGNAVRTIISDVRKNGDVAIIKYAARFDKLSLKPSSFKVSPEEISAAAAQIDDETKKFIALAIRNILCFAAKRKPQSWKFSPRRGVELGEKITPLQRVGVYVPAASAPLVSTAIHTAAIAKAAGVREIAATTPGGKNGGIAPALLYALSKSGATEIYRLGGVYGIAAFAYGTESVGKVEKIVGPGNAYVTAAKKIVSGDVAIDMAAGPSEIMIIADGKNNPEFIAADILSQAEHGSGHEQAVLLSPCRKLISNVLACLKKQSVKLFRAKPVSKVMKNGVFLVEVENLSQAADIAGEYAPEHLEILCKNPEKVAAKVKAAGAIFIGEWTPEPVGDYVAGPSHVLPTGGTSKFFSGLSIGHFFRRSSIIKYSRKALLNELPAIAKFAELENLDAHANSAKIRFSPKIQ